MSILYSLASRYGRRKPLLAGLAILVLICLSFAYTSTESQSETIAAEKLVGFHKKLQQVNDFEPVKFLPVRSSTNSQQSQKIDKQQQIIDAVKAQNEAIRNIGDDDNLEYDHEVVHDVIQPPNQRVQYNFKDAPVYFPNQNLANWNQNGVPAVVSQRSSEPYIPEHRIVHFDLKGAPPTMAYMKKVVSMSKRLGATGVLIEYEDMFPWSGRLELVAHKAHYSLEEVKDFVAYCENLGLEVIPLVQTFGHLEFVLKHEEFSYLRDVPEMPESICPCHEDTMSVIRDIVDQVMAVHPKASYLHIGCDEVYHLGECQPCAANMTGRNEIFLNHVSNVANHVRDTWQVTPIVWDDMLRNFMVDEMKPLASLVEPMVWVYAPDVERFAPSYTWDRFEQVFDNIWTASAFKGAHGETLVTPDIKKHLENNLNWLALMREEEPRLSGKFRGIVLTGWQRYDHFAVLCELLPAAIPSLAVNLLATSQGYFNDSMKSSLMKELNCPDHSQHQFNRFGGAGEKFFDLDYDRFLFQKLSWCYFPGQKFYKVTADLISTEETVDDFIKTVEKKKGWLTDYNVRHNMSSPFRIDQVLEDWPRMNHLVVALMRQANTALSEMFDHYTASEWIEQKIYPMYSKLSQIRTKAEVTKTVKAWPSRPYPPLESLLGLGIGLPQQTTERQALVAANDNKNYVEPRLVAKKLPTKSNNVYYSSKPQNLDAKQFVAHNNVLNNHVQPNMEHKPGVGSSQFVRMSNHL